MKNATSWIIRSAFALSLWLSASLLPGSPAKAADHPPAAAPPATAAAPTPPAKAGQEVTLKGELGCGKCSFKKTAACQNVLKVKEGGKDVMYFLAENAVSEDKHEAVCSGTKPATVTGTVAEEGKGAKKKKVLTASAIKVE
jgi:hypothetical protein